MGSTSMTATKQCITFQQTLNERQSGVKKGKGSLLVDTTDYFTLLVTTKKKSA